MQNRVLLLLVVMVFALADTFAAPRLSPHAPTKVTFSVLSACATSGTPSFSARIAGTEVASIPVGACSCDATPEEVVITHPTLLALVGQPLCTGVSVGLAGGATYLSWMKAEVTRPTGVETICLADPTGRGCSTSSLCEASYAEVVAGSTWTQAPGDLDGDGLDNCSDPDLDGDGVPNGTDTCPVVADPTNLDTDGDGAGDVCPAAASEPDVPAQPLDVITVPWLGNRAFPHEVYPGGRLHLQGIAVYGDDTPATVIEATWDPGDGTGPVSVNPTNALALELLHTYQGTPGQQFTATLTVTDVNGAVESDTFLVAIKHRTLDVEVNMAIDNGLWFLHKQLMRTTQDGVKTAYVLGGYGMPATPSAVLAFAMNHHVATGDGRLNPYVHNVNRLLRWLEANLQTVAIGPQASGNPDTNGNGLGVTVLGRSNENYVNGHITAAFIASEQPDRVAVLGQTNIKGRTYRDLMQDMVDFSAWGQMDSNLALPHRGSWHYTGSGDGHANNSVSMWVAGGLIAAERVWGLTVPNFVKVENDAAVRATWNPNGSLGYLSTQPIWGDEATTPSGVIQWTLDGRTEANAEMNLSLRRTAHGLRAGLRAQDIYVLLASSRAYRLLRGANGLPSPRFIVDDDPADGIAAWDWFRNDPLSGAAGPTGVARTVIATQSAQGQFHINGYTDMQALRQPWAILVLSPTVFERGPRAACSASPNPTSGPITFDASDSFHPIEGRTISSYEWTFGDGATAGGAQVLHTYTLAAGQTATRTATLTVRDDRGNTHTTSCVVTVDTTNAAPVATDQQFSMSEDAAVSGNVLTGATDADGDPLTASVSIAPAHGTLTLNADGSFTYTPHTNYHGADSFIAVVTDGRGGTDTATISLTVTPINDAPVAGDVSLTLIEDTVASGNVLANASDIDNDVLTATLVTGPTHGTLVLNADGSFTYSPSVNHHGTDSFTFTAHDGQATSNTATVTLIITPVNDAPSLAWLPDLTEEATSAAGATVTFDATGIDVEDGPITATCSPAAGSVFPLGTTAVTCTVTDEAGAGASRTFSVTVVDTTAPAIAAMSDISESATSAAGAVISYSAPATLDLVGGTGVATCAPASGSTFGLGTTTVTCSASDPAGNSASSTFTVTVIEVVQDTTAPVITYTGNAGTYDVSGTVNITCAATDAVGVVSTTCVDITGPATNFAIGTNTFTATATDAAGNTGTGSTTFTVVVSTAGFEALITQMTGNSAGQLVAAARNVASAPNANARAGRITAFRNQVNAQLRSGRITAQQAALLNSLIAAIP